MNDHTHTPAGQDAAELLKQVQTGAALAAKSILPWFARDTIAALAALVEMLLGRVSELEARNAGQDALRLYLLDKITEAVMGAGLVSDPPTRAQLVRHLDDLLAANEHDGPFDAGTIESVRTLRELLADDPAPVQDGQAGQATRAAPQDNGSPAGYGGDALPGDGSSC